MHCLIQLWSFKSGFLTKWGEEEKWEIVYLIWQMSLEHLQILALQAPVLTDDRDSKYVTFSEVVEPQPSVTKWKWCYSNWSQASTNENVVCLYWALQPAYLHVQHTPKPWAQLPALVPPLEEHSSLIRTRKNSVFQWTKNGCLFQQKSDFSASFSFLAPKLDIFLPIQLWLFPFSSQKKPEKAT